MENHRLTQCGRQSRGDRGSNPRTHTFAAKESAVERRWKRWKGYNIYLDKLFQFLLIARYVPPFRRLEPVGKVMLLARSPLNPL